MPRLNSPFMIAAPIEGTKRPVWKIRDRHGGLLGEVGWYASWRRFTFLPSEYVVLSADCLEALAQFIEDAMAEAKAAV